MPERNRGSGSDSDTPNTAANIKYTISPSIDLIAKDTSDLCGLLYSEVAVFLIDCNMDSDPDQLHLLEKTSTELSDIILPSLRLSKVKLSKKKDEMEDQHGDCLRSPNQSVKRRKSVYKSPVSNMEPTIPNIMRSLTKFVVLFESKAEYIATRRSLQNLDIDKLTELEDMADLFIRSSEKTQDMLKQIIARMKAVLHSNAATTATHQQLPA